MEILYSCKKGTNSWDVKTIANTVPKSINKMIIN
jgi:hypothetical protein